MNMIVFQYIRQLDLGLVVTHHTMQSLLIIMSSKVHRQCLQAAAELCGPVHVSAPGPGELPWQGAAKTK